MTAIKINFTDRFIIKFLNLTNFIKLKIDFSIINNLL